jgi:AcrR family transcriptional regulator
VRASSYIPRPPATPRRRLSHKDVTRKRIRDAARALFGARPFEEVSMEDVARDADVGRTTIYFHYATKSALMVDLLKEDWDRQAEHFALIEQIPVVDRQALRAWLEHFAGAVRVGGELFRTSVLALALSDDLRRLQFEHRERLIGILARRIPAFTPRTGADPARRRAAAASHALVTLIESYGGLAAEDPSPAEVEVAAEILLDALDAFVRLHTPQA